MAEHRNVYRPSNLKSVLEEVRSNLRDMRAKAADLLKAPADSFAGRQTHEAFPSEPVKSSDTERR